MFVEYNIHILCRKTISLTAHPLSSASCFMSCRVWKGGTNGKIKKSKNIFIFIKYSEQDDRCIDCDIVNLQPSSLNMKLLVYHKY